MRYMIIYHEFTGSYPLVEVWDMPLLEVINRCRMIFKEGVYKRAEIIEHNPRYIIENNAMEKYIEDDKL